MSPRIFIAALAAALSLAPATASAQALATFGSAEVAGFGEGSALIGSAMTTGRLGWGPIATLIAQTYRYRLQGGLCGCALSNAHAQAYALSPSLGLQYSMPEGAVQASFGYTFVNTDGPAPIVGVEAGSVNSTFVSAQGNYWGDGENAAQAIATYGFKSEYYWTRLRASHRLAPSSTPIYLGAEVVFQGTQKTGVGLLPSSRYQLGPTLEYRFTPDFRAGVSGGYRGGNNGDAGTGYARVEFLLLTKL